MARAERMLMERAQDFYARLQWEETPEHRPYAGALYRNKRSGKEWQFYGQIRPGEIPLRQERRLLGGFGWFRFCSVTLDQLERNWEYIGPMPPGHYLWGYELSDPREPVSPNPEESKP